jgi:class 3 adenylate cyclase
MTSEPATLCLGCWQNLHMPIALRGPFSVPFRVFGIKPSRMNPNTCTICEMAFSRIMKARAITIDATIMFADLRGYTTLTQTIGQAGLTSLLDAFYDDCAAAIWRHDGLLNKTIGDAVLAIFNFPVKRATIRRRRCLRRGRSSSALPSGAMRCRRRSAGAMSSLASESASTVATPISASSAARTATSRRSARS